MTLKYIYMINKSLYIYVMNDIKVILNLNIDLYLSDLIKGCLTILALEILWDMIKTLCFYEKG